MKQPNGATLASGSGRKGRSEAREKDGVSNASKYGRGQRAGKEVILVRKRFLQNRRSQNLIANAHSGTDKMPSCV